MFQIEVVEKIKTHILFSVTLFRKSRRLADKVKKHGGAREATDNNIQIWRMHFSCWTIKTTDTHTQKYVTFIACPRQQWFIDCVLTVRHTHTACPVNTTDKRQC
jgi:hypothetical protein